MLNVDKRSTGSSPIENGIERYGLDVSLSGRVLEVK